MTLWVWALPLGFLLDVLLGDPQWIPHPVRWIGAWALRAEHHVRKVLGDGIVSGIVFWFCVVGLVVALVWSLQWVAYGVHPYLGNALQVWLVYQGLAMRDLDREVRQIAKHLREGDLEGARKATSRIVSRNTEQMDEAALSRSAIESAAENGVDGVVSPLFWGILLGPVGLWAFKAVSTLDSMVGYRTPQYERFGKFAARVDDVMNWIPARLALVLYPLAAIPHWNKVVRALRVGWRDRRKHASPNSGYSEAIMAGYLGVRLGGPAVYHGVRKEKPWFGAEFRDANHKDICAALRVVWVAAGAIVVVFLALML